MRLLSLLFGVCVLFLLGACRIVKPQDGYSELASGWKEIVVPLSTFEQVKRSEITRINGEQLRDELKKHPKAIVRFVVNYCPANSNLKSMEDFAIANGYRMFIVMYDFRLPFEIFNQQIKDPIFVIDTPYYKTTNVRVSTKSFKNEMLKRDKRTKVDYQSFYVFHNGIYVPAEGDLIDKRMNTVVQL